VLNSMRLERLGSGEATLAGAHGGRIRARLRTPETRGDIRCRAGNLDTVFVCVALSHGDPFHSAPGRGFSAACGLCDMRRRGGRWHCFSARVLRRWRRKLGWASDATVISCARAPAARQPVPHGRVSGKGLRAAGIPGHAGGGGGISRPTGWFWWSAGDGLGYFDGSAVC
jgi:hypothetical protein